MNNIISLLTVLSRYLSIQLHASTNRYANQVPQHPNRPGTTDISLISGLRNGNNISSPFNQSNSIERLNFRPYSPQLLCNQPDRDTYKVAVRRSRCSCTVAVAHPSLADHRVSSYPLNGFLEYCSEPCHWRQLNSTQSNSIRRYDNWSS